MTAQHRPQFWLVCNSCGAEHHDPESDSSAFAIRVSGSIHGWKLMDHKKRRFDWCPKCAEKSLAELLATSLPDPNGQAVAS